MMNSPNQATTATTAVASIDTLSPSVIAKQRSALEQLCDFAITSDSPNIPNPKNSPHMAAMTAELANMPTPSPVPPDVKTCRISSKSPALLPPFALGVVHVYDQVERKTRIERYLEKRKHKTWARQVRYPSRQGSAEVRTRVKGRFVKKTDFAPAPQLV